MTEQPLPLIERDISEAKIRFMRMITGEDLITEYVSVKEKDDQEYYVFMNPMRIIYIQGIKPGSIGVSMVEWVFPKICSDQDFVIFPNDVLTMGKPTSKMLDYYLRLREEELMNLETGSSEDKDASTDDDLLDALEEFQTDKKRLLH